MTVPSKKVLQQLERAHARKRKEVDKQIAALQIVGEVAKLDLWPGDIIVLSTDWNLTVDQLARLRAQISETLGRLGVTNEFVFLTSGLRMNVIRPEKAEAAA